MTKAMDTGTMQDAIERTMGATVALLRLHLGPGDDE